jgi:hypothetical protein
MSNHTPAPWTVETDSEGIFVRMDVLAGKDEYIPVYAAPYNEYDREPSYRRIADARLIASAPSLLEALERQVMTVEGVPTHTYWCAKPDRPDDDCDYLCMTVRAAIKLARGEVVPGA